MEELKCADVHFWMQQIILTDKQTLPVPAAAAHIAGCPFCRGAFVLLAAEIVDLSSLATSISCLECEVDLAAFVEQEVEEGSAAAIGTYPHVWWHLWTCEDCMEIYNATRSYLTGDQSLTWTPSVDVVVLPNKPTRTPKLRLPRHLLHHALASSVVTQLAVRSGASQSYILAEQDESDSHLTISVQLQVNGEWRVDVVHEPAPVGSLVLTFGTHHFQTRFNAQGRAVIHNIPSALLIGSEGPDLEVDIDFNATARPSA